jgi:hypothetical protein
MAYVTPPGEVLQQFVRSGGIRLLLEDAGDPQLTQSAGGIILFLRSAGGRKLVRDVTWRKRRHLIIDRQQVWARKRPLVKGGEMGEQRQEKAEVDSGSSSPDEGPKGLVQKEGQAAAISSYILPAAAVTVALAVPLAVLLLKKWRQQQGDRCGCGPLFFTVAVCIGLQLFAGKD